MKEVWKEIDGYEGLYQVSNFGQVRGMDRIVNGRKLKGNFLKHDIVSGGYHRISLCNNNIRKNYLISRLVAKNFIDNPKNLEYVNHKDLDKNNNHIDNLEWISRHENQIHFCKSNLAEQRYLKTSCEKNPKSKLKDIDVSLIRKLRNEFGLKHKTLAWLFDVNKTTIQDIVYKKSWKYVEYN